MILMTLIRPEAVPSRAARPGAVLPSETEELLTRFGEYLRDERGLTATTSALYLYQLRLFALWFVAGFGSDLTVMTIAAVDQFYVDRAGIWSTSKRGLRVDRRRFRLARRDGSHPRQGKRFPTHAGACRCW